MDKTSRAGTTGKKVQFSSCQIIVQHEKYWLADRILKTKNAIDDYKESKDKIKSS